MAETVIDLHTRRPPPSAPDLRRRELGAFLRKRRSALRPEDVGLPRTGRRHVKGLRREEVAQLAQIGMSWYTLLEQGRVDAVSERVLQRISDALRLSAAERRHVFALARASFSAIPVPPGPARAAVVRFAERFAGGPAVLVNADFGVIAWNAAADALYAFSSREPSARNLLELMLVDSAVQETFPAWREVVPNMIGVLRGIYAQTGATEIDLLVAHLSTTSPIFASVWSDRPFHEVSHELCRVRSGDGSDRLFELTTWTPGDDPGIALICLLPAEEGA